jgi:hypothetical protein
MKLRHGAEPKAVRELRTKESGRMLQRALCFLRSCLSFEDGKEYLGMSVIAADLNSRERHHSHARVLQLEANDLREIALQLIGDAPKTG